MSRAYVKHRDTLTMAMTATLAGAISMLAQFGLFVGGDRRSNSPLGPLVTLLAVIAAPIAATLVQMAISRSRSTPPTRPDPQISQTAAVARLRARSKLCTIARPVPHADRRGQSASAHLFIVNPLLGGGLRSLFMTHPATEDRIARLEEIAAQMGQTALPDDAAGRSASGDRPR